MGDKREINEEIHLEGLYIDKSNKALSNPKARYIYEDEDAKLKQRKTAFWEPSFTPDYLFAIINQPLSVIVVEMGNKH